MTVPNYKNLAYHLRSLQQSMRSRSEWDDTPTFSDMDSENNSTRGALANLVVALLREAVLTKEDVAEIFEQELKDVEDMCKD